MLESGLQLGQRVFGGAMAGWIEGFVLMSFLSRVFIWAVAAPQVGRGSTID